MSDKMDKKIKKFCGEPSEKYWAFLGNVAPSLIQVARFCVVNSMGNVELAIRILTLAGVWSLPTLPKLVDECDGYWKKDCLKYGKKYNPSAPKGCPQSRISKDQWPTKKIFLHKLKRVEDFILGSYKDKNYGFSKGFLHSISYYLGRANSRIEDGYQVGSVEFSIKNKAGKIICWPGGFRSHYLETYNVLPSQELYDAVMNFILPISPKGARPAGGFLPKLLFGCDGYWKKDCLKYGKKYNPSAPKGCPQSRISKDQWPTKEIFLHKLKRVETLIRKRGRMMGSNDNYGIKFYKGPAHSRITDEWVGNEELEIRNKAGKIICWPGGFRSHYLETYNVLPSQELYDAVMNFNLPYY